MDEDVTNELIDSQPEPEAQPEPKDESVPLSEFNKVYARAKSAEAELKKYRKEAEPQKQEFDIEDVVDLRQQGFSREETDRIKAFARANGTSLRDAAKDPFVQAGINGLRNSSKSDEATPVPGRPVTSPPSDSKPWSSMTKEERQSSFSSQLARYRKGRPSNE